MWQEPPGLPGQQYSHSAVFQTLQPLGGAHTRLASKAAGAGTPGSATAAVRIVVRIEIDDFILPNNSSKE